jgi:hypothetical protein
MEQNTEIHMTPIKNNETKIRIPVDDYSLKMQTFWADLVGNVAQILSGDIRHGGTVQNTTTDSRSN